MRKGLIEVKGQAVFFHSQKENSQIIIVVGLDSEFIGLNLTRILSHFQLRSADMNFDVVSYAYDYNIHNFNIFISNILYLYDKIDLVLTGNACFKLTEIPNVVLTSIVIYSPICHNPEVGYNHLESIIQTRCLVIQGEESVPDDFKKNGYNISDIGYCKGCINEIEWIKSASSDILQFVIN